MQPFGSLSINSRLLLTVINLGFLVGCGSDGHLATTSTEDSRVTTIDRSLVLDTKGAVVSEDDPGLKFTYLASVDAPINPSTGSKLQASNFDEYNSIAVVTYLTAGIETSGAIDIIDLKNYDKPRLISTHIFEDAEFSAIVLNKKTAYIIGAHRFTGAMLWGFDVSDPNSLKELFRIELPGYYATDIQLVDSSLWISVGDNLGLIQFDISKTIIPKEMQQIELPNALSLTSFDNEIFSMGGKDHTSIFKIEGKLNEIANVADRSLEAPARMAADGKVLISNAGSRFLVYDMNKKSKNTYQKFFESDLPGTGNGATLSYSFAFLAQGEEGLHVYDLGTPTKATYMGKFDFSDDNGSANNVKACLSSKGGHIFVADGRGGFRIIKANYEIKLKALKNVSPLSYQSDLRSLNGAITYIIPQIISVTEGNAGNAISTLRFDNVICTYKGGSKKSTPTDSADIKRGLKYNFVSCSDGSKHGENISAANDIELSIESSSTSSPQTKAEARIPIVLK